MQSPADDPEAREQESRPGGEEDVPKDQNECSGRQRGDAAETIGEQSRRVGTGCVDEIHHHHDEWHPRDREAGLLTPQNEEGIAEPGQGEQTRQKDGEPECLGKLTGKLSQCGQG